MFGLNLEDFKNKVPFFGPVYSILTNESFWMLIFGSAATYVSSNLLEQNLIAALAVTGTLIIVGTRQWRDLRNSIVAKEAEVKALIQKGLHGVDFYLPVPNAQPIRVNLPDSLEAPIAAEIYAALLAVIPESDALKNVKAGFTHLPSNDQ